MAPIVEDDARTSNRVKTYFERGAKAAGITLPAVEMTCAAWVRASFLSPRAPHSYILSPGAAV